MRLMVVLMPARLLRDRLLLDLSFRATHLLLTFFFLELPVVRWVAAFAGWYAAASRMPAK
jgi:hypothetical protein